MRVLSCNPLVEKCCQAQELPSLLEFCILGEIAVTFLRFMDDNRPARQYIHCFWSIEHTHDTSKRQVSEGCIRHHRCRYDLGNGSEYHSQPRQFYGRQATRLAQRSVSHHNATLSARGTSNWQEYLVVCTDAAQHPLQPTAPSALVVSRPFDFAGILVQCGGLAHPALRLSFSVGLQRI